MLKSDLADGDEVLVIKTEGSKLLKGTVGKVFWILGDSAKVRTIFKDGMVCSEWQPFDTIIKLPERSDNV